MERKNYRIWTSFLLKLKKIKNIREYYIHFVASKITISIYLYPLNVMTANCIKSMSIVYLYAAVQLIFQIWSR